MRKFLALVLSCILSVSAVSMVANAARFTDVPANDEVLADAVDLLASVGITSGTTETTFGTSEGVTRQQMATFIYRLMKAGKSVEGKEGDNTTSFTDLDDPYYYFMVSWANEMGIIKGKSETTFDPKGGIILQDAYTMIVRALGYEDKETLGYPFDYIEIAEKIGLDNGLPSNVNYDTALTRGNTAVILYNAFYADMAHGITIYEPEFDVVEHKDTGVTDVIEVGSKPHTVYDTVAEKIFGLKKTVQRVVATPNYCLDNNAKTDSDTDGYESLTVKCFDKNYVETDSGLFGEIVFDTLGLSGKADDYFLMDLAIYYKETESNGLEIISASSLGTYKKQLPSSKVVFEQSKEYYYQNDSHWPAATGKVTIDGQVSYLFDAPWSYSKPDNVNDKDNECITLLWLDATDRDPEDEEYVMDFNFKSHRDVLGRGKNDYDVEKTYYLKKNGKHEAISVNMVDSDLRGYGIYSVCAMKSLMQINYTSTKFEADVWDSNSDGKYDYMWLKPYTVGMADAESESLIDMHVTGLDAISAVIEGDEISKIYTCGATTEGVKFKDGQLITAYVNGPANYIKVANVSDIEYVKNQKRTSVGSDTNRTGFTDISEEHRGGLSRVYVGTPTNSGTSIVGIAKPGDFADYTNANIGKIDANDTAKFDILLLDNKYLFHVKMTASALESTSNYAMIFPNTLGHYAYTTSIAVVENGSLTKSSNVLEVLIDGELVNVAVKPQTSKTLEENNYLYEADGKTTLKDKNGDPISSKPVTAYESEADVYDFSDYVGKLLTYTINADNEYVFTIAPVEGNRNVDVLATDKDAYYAFEAGNDGWISAAFVKSTGNRYRFLAVGKDTVSLDVHPKNVKYLTFGENTRVLIKTEDEEGEPVFKIYDSENMPNFSNKDELKNIKYIVKNNPKSTSNEELIYMYAEVDGKTSIKSGSTLDYRFVKSSKVVSAADGKVVYYDVYNPFKGIVEEEYEAVTESESKVCDKFGIYSLSNGYIDDENKLGAVNAIGKMATSVTDKDARNLGLVEINEYDAENGFLTIDGETLTFIVDEDTKVTFIDLDKGEISKKDVDILSSKAKAYRCDDNTKVPLLAFVASSEIKKEDEFEHAEVICVVRYNALAELYTSVKE